MKDTSLSRIKALISNSPRKGEVDPDWLKDELYAIEYFELTEEVIDAFNTELLYRNPNNSSLAYVIGLTNDPPKGYPDGLAIERGTSGGHPDIDLDFDTRFRDEMIEYCRQKYGEDHVANIITYSSIKARSAVRDTVRILDHPFSVGSKLIEKMPPLVAGFDTPLEYCFERHDDYERGYADAADLRTLYDSGDLAYSDVLIDNKGVREILDGARGLEGLKRQDGIHAAAVVISDEPLTEYLPVQRKKVKGKPGPLVTQYDMDTVDEIGLLKMDFLGLKNLDIISDTLALIKERTGEEVSVEYADIDLEDSATLELIDACRTAGVFQIESLMMRDTIRAMGVERFEDLAALNALCRPGPMADNMHVSYGNRKKGREDVTSFHPEALEILKDTQGLCIYQEQLMAIAQHFAGYSLGEGYLLIKACAKKKKELMRSERVRFVQGCEDRGYGASLGHEIFDIIEPFASYSFNASHAFAYGFISFQTAYLKAHHPVEYMCSLLTANIDKGDKLTVYLNECQRMGIKVYPPNINLSNSMFYPINDTSISFPLEGIKGIGSEFTNQIIEEREAEGEFKSFSDFCERVPLKALNKKILHSLILTGCFPGESIRGLEAVYEEHIKKVRNRRRKAKIDDAQGTFDIDDETSIAYEGIPISDSERTDIEVEYLGAYISSHPLDYIESLPVGAIDISDLVELEEAAYVKVAGVMSSVDVKTTRKGDRMAVVDVQDKTGSFPLIIFPNEYAEFSHLVKKKALVTIELNFNMRDDRRQYFAKRIANLT